MQKIKINKISYMFVTSKKKREKTINTITNNQKLPEQSIGK